MGSPPRRSSFIAWPTTTSPCEPFACRPPCGNENFTFVIDTFHDRRNGYLFQTNPLGALRDMTVTDDQQNSAWNGIWYVKTGRFEKSHTRKESPRKISTADVCS